MSLLKQFITIKASTIFFMFCWLSLLGQAQDDPMKYDQFNLNKPSMSQRAEVSQKIGIGFVKVNYSRPNVNGRKIFGGLLKFGEVWRLGADYQTVIDFQQEFVVMNDTIKPGKYAMYAIPYQNSWKIILNEDIKGWGQYSYEASQDKYTFEVAVESSPEFTETFTIGFSNTTLNRGNLYIQWENSRVHLPITISHGQRREILNILDYALGENKKSLGYRYYLVSEYLFIEEQNNEKALEYLNKAINLGIDGYYVQFLRAQILYENGDKEEAIKTIKIANEKVPKNSNDSDWKYRIEQKLKEWKIEK